MFRLQRPSVTRPDSLANLRRHGFGLLAPLTALAAALALFFQRSNIDPLDKVALPLIAALMLLLQLALRRNWLQTRAGPQRLLLGLRRVFVDALSPSILFVRADLSHAQ